MLMWHVAVSLSLHHVDVAASCLLAGVGHVACGGGCGQSLGAVVAVSDVVRQGVIMEEGGS